MFKHKSGGGGAPIETTSPIYQYGVDTGNPKPPMTDSWPSDKVTRKLPMPKGEKPRYYDDSTPARYSESGANYATPEGPTAAPGINAPTGGYPLNRGVPEGVPNRNRFTQALGRIDGGTNTASAGPSNRDRGVAYKDGQGRTKYRGRTG